MSVPPLHARPLQPLRVPRGAVARVLTALALLTIVSGVMQLFDPARALAPLGADPATVGPAGLFHFGAIGALLVVFGGLLLHAVLSPTPYAPVFLWVGAEKLVYATMAAMGVSNGLYARPALLVTALDVVAATLCLLQWRATRAQA
ncbi:MAG TPA: hypothetical protein VKA84_16630 [Gemmatimonadaceae bacterium]|nr:hypothetical protein [Gemmatimonadaceae bacterium]